MTDLHEACYGGKVEAVRRLLLSGADPNAPAPTGGRTWISDEGAAPRPLNCVAVARAIGPEHVEAARLLLAHGGVVTASVLRDLDVEGVGSPIEAELRRVLLTAYQGAS